MEGNNEMASEHMIGKNYYYQKRINLDPERCKLNMERALKRKQRESQVNVACDHYRTNDKCQIRNISYEELEEFHDRYWNCPGTVNKRIFMATHLAVDPTDNDCKKDINITCYCPRNDGTLDVICQKSFISVLGVSKHKVLGIGHAKLINGEYLYKEKRGGNRWKPCSINDDKNKCMNDSGMNYSNENSQNYSNINDNDSTMGSNLSENGGLNMKKKQPNFNTNEDNGESNKSYESNRKASNPQKSKPDNIEETNEDDNAIFEPQIKDPKRESACTAGDKNENEQINIFQPVVEIKEKLRNENEENTLRIQTNLRKTSSDNSATRDNSELESLPTHMLRKQSAYDSVEERMAARQKARAILENLHLQANKIKRPPQFGQPYNFPNQLNRFNQPSHSSWQSRNYPPNFATQRNFPTSSYMGPENWQRTLERNIRRRQRMQEVKIDCNHNLTRFCKVISVAHEDLVNFHNMYWNCQGIVEERIFLARFMVVTPCNHRREMAIATRIPTSDGQLVEVCQKSFLSVVGITKHKVQAAARAKLKGTLFRKDQRGGFQKPRSQTEQTSRASPNMQISKVEGRYENRERQFRAFNESETIEIEDSSDDERENNGDNDNSSNRNINFEDSQTGNGEEDEEGDSEIIAAEDAFASGKLNYYEFRKNIRKSRVNEIYEAQLTQLKRELNLYKRRTRKLVLDRKNYITKLTKLRMENIKLRKQSNALHKISNGKKLGIDLFLDEKTVNKPNNENSNQIETTDSIELNSNLHRSEPKETYVSNERGNITISNFESNFENYEKDIILNKISENYPHFDSSSNILEKIANIDIPTQSDNS